MCIFKALMQYMAGSEWNYFQFHQNRKQIFLGMPLILKDFYIRWIVKCLNQCHPVTTSVNWVPWWANWKRISLCLLQHFKQYLTVSGFLHIVDNFLLTNSQQGSVWGTVWPGRHTLFLSATVCASYHKVKHILCLSFSLHRRAKAGTT